MILDILVFIIFVILTYIFYIRFKYRNFPPGLLNFFFTRPYGVPLFGYLPFLGPNPHKKYGEIAKIYGNIFSINFGNLPIIILNDLENIKKAFRNDVFSGRPKSVLAMRVISDGTLIRTTKYKTITKHLISSLTFNEGQAWIEQRKFTIKVLRDLGFGKSSLDALASENVTGLITHLRKQVGQPISLKRIFEISVINNLWSIVASDKHEFDDPEINKLHKLNYEGFIELEVAGPVYFMGWLAKLAPHKTGYINLQNAVTNLRQFYRNVIMLRKKEYSSHHLNDFIDYYLKEIENTANPKSSFYGENGIKNLVDLLINLFAAGSDTTSSTLCWGFLYLMYYPDIMLKVQEEIDAIIGRKYTPKIEDRQKMPYTEATINEIFRMSSIVSGGLLHSTLETTKFEGFQLPKGTIVMANLYNVHHDIKYWGDPENFRPDRFIGSNGEFIKNEGLIPFSTGKRICPAEHLAVTNVFLNLTGILQNFNLEISQEHPLPNLYAKLGLVLSTQPYKIILRERYT